MGLDAPCPGNSTAQIVFVESLQCKGTSASSVAAIPMRSGPRKQGQSAPGVGRTTIAPAKSDQKRNLILSRCFLPFLYTRQPANPRPDGRLFVLRNKRLDRSAPEPKLVGIVRNCAD